jgi:uncharacterized protein YceH (UPF0502 family)
MASVMLDPEEARVLGCLIEKELTTPDYYPLSLNALVNACNQKSNREPVVQYDEATVRDAMERLRHHGLGTVLTGGEHRVPKYGHRAYERLDLGRREIAVLAVLLLRGPQTLGEIKERTGRMYEFDDVESVESTLRKLAGHADGPVAVQLPKQPGMREARYAHLLCGDPVLPAPEPQPVSLREDRLAKLEAEVAELKAAFEEFRRQFS